MSVWSFLVENGAKLVGYETKAARTVKLAKEAEEAIRTAEAERLAAENAKTAATSAKRAATAAEKATAKAVETETAKAAAPINKRYEDLWGADKSKWPDSARLQYGNEISRVEAEVKTRVATEAKAAATAPAAAVAGNGQITPEIAKALEVAKTNKDELGFINILQNAGVKPEALQVYRNTAFPPRPSTFAGHIPAWITNSGIVVGLGVAATGLHYAVNWGQDILAKGFGLAYGPGGKAILNDLEQKGGIAPPTPTAVPHLPATTAPAVATSPVQQPVERPRSKITFEGTDPAQPPATQPNVQPANNPHPLFKNKAPVVNLTH